MVRFKGVNHLAFATGDMDKTIRFWRDLLGMRLVATNGQPGFRHYFFELSETDTVAFFEWDGIEPVEEKGHGVAMKGPFIFDHVSFGVDEEEDLWTLKDRLTSAGFEVTGVIDHGFIHSIYSFDPNGIPIEFSHDVAGFDIRAKPIWGDQSASAITREGAEPRPGKWPEVLRPTPVAKRSIKPGAGSVLTAYMEEEPERAAE